MVVFDAAYQTAYPIRYHYLSCNNQGDALTAISLKLPNELARKSTKAAEKMGISRAELIRVALEHELADR